MDYGVCHLSIIPVRKEPSHRSEMLTQLLFGETYTIQEMKGEWAAVTVAYDSYSGWISNAQLQEVGEQEFRELTEQCMHISAEMVQIIYNSTRNITQGIFIGSTIPPLNEERFILAGDDYRCHGNLREGASNQGARFTVIEENIKKFIYAPYLWGGRSPFGIDCSGFVQVMFKIGGVQLPRDARQQAEIGEMIYFINDAVPGDLLFFDNEDGLITHTGIYLGSNKIAHASGMVRIDEVDTTGIFNKEWKKYTHKLRMIKRIF